jgi:predicted porin
LEKLAMKKSLVALAAFAAVSAYAQSSVTLYGVVDVGYGSQTTTSRDGSGSIKSRGVMDGANAGSRIGFRGTEDLGGGLKANFVVEQGISPTNGSLFGVRTATAGHQVDGFSAAGSAAAVSGAAGGYSIATNRQTYVGLSSAAVGTLNVGYQYTINYELGTLSGYNIGSEGVPGADKAHLYGNAMVGSTRANGFTYISPNFSGFTVRAQYGAAGGRETVESNTALTNGYTTDKNRRMGLMLSYANGPLSLAIGHTNMKSTQANGVGAAGAATNVYGVVGAAGTTVLTGAERTANLTQLGGSYDFGMVKVAGTHNRGKNGGTTTSTVSSKYRATQLGVSMPFGALVPFVTVGRASTTNDATGARTEDYKSMQVGLRYNLSKRTTAYAFYGQTKNESAAATGATTWYKDKKTVVGVMHAF